MLRQLTGSEGDDRRRTDQTDDGAGLLGAVPFVAAFAAGFALGRRSRRESLPGYRERRHEAPERTTESGEAATDQPSSMGSVSGEAERQREREGGAGGRSETGRAVEGDAGETAESEAEGRSEGETGTTQEEMAERAAELSPPTTRGMPILGLGTYQNDEYARCLETVRQAVEMGYRHVDTAQMYDNETAVGDAIVEAELGREDLFVASKVDPDNLAYDHVIRSAEESLERLGMDTLDLLYVHWPTGEYEPIDTLDAFAELRQEGLVEEIGVSNFTVDLLEQAIEVSDEPIFANQVEMHPLLPQTELREFCARDDVDVELVAYSPIARTQVEEVDEIREVARKHDATPEQVSLAWLREKDVTAIPKATGREHLLENWLSLGVELDDEDVAKIDGIDRRERVVDPDGAPWN